MESCYRQSESKELSQWVGDEKESDGHDGWRRVTKVEKDIEGATVIKSIRHQNEIKKKKNERAGHTKQQTHKPHTYGHSRHIGVIDIRH